MHLPQRLNSAQETDVHIRGYICRNRCRSFDQTSTARRGQPTMLPHATSQEEAQLQVSVSLYKDAGSTCLPLALDLRYISDFHPARYKTIS